jgi:DNA repair exonuclease SbcCD ATPase subunit
MTRREKLEARVERRRQWAESRERSGEAARERVHQIADQIPFGQPILVGHHSEAGARADQRRIENGMRSAVDNWRMAEHHEEKAQGIERQLRTSIFSDDADAVEQLEAKIAKLEAKRDSAKLANAAYRKEHAAELKTMGAYARSIAVPVPAYSLTSYGAEIRRCRDRIEQIKRDQAAQASGVRTGGRVMASRYGGTCPDCGEDFARGEMITWYHSTREAVHVACQASAAAL